VGWTNVAAARLERSTSQQLRAARRVGGGLLTPEKPPAILVRSFVPGARLNLEVV